MKANEFVKKFGWGEAKKVVTKETDLISICPLNFYEDLKRLVESWELVESYKSRFGDDAEWLFISEYCKKNRISPFFSENYNEASSLYRQAITDVESCNEN